MADRYDERITAAHVALREKEWVAQRIAEAEAERDRLQGEVAKARRVLAKEQADVDQLGIVFRILAKHRAEVDREHGEVATAHLQLDGLLEELRATEYDLRGLRERAALVDNASIEYDLAIADKELHVRLDPGPLGQQLSAIAERERETRAARHEVAEAIAAGHAAHEALVAVQGAIAAIHGDVLHEIAGQLGVTRRALAGYQRECKDVTARAPCVPVTPLTIVLALCAQDLSWNAIASDADLLAEVQRVLVLVEDTLSALRERDAQLERGLDRIARERATLLDVPR